MISLFSPFLTHKKRSTMPRGAFLLGGQGVDMGAIL